MKLGETCGGCGLTVKKEHATKDKSGKRTGYADPCMGILPGVKYACCGHGNDPHVFGYIFFENGVTIRFNSIVEVELTTFSQYHKFNEETTQPKN